MIIGQLVGGEQLISRINAMPAAIKGRLKTTIQRLTFQLLSHVKADKLSDQVLRVRTGRLRRSITQEVQIEGEKIIGIVGTNVEYARAHEYGYTGAVTVKSHIRRLKTGKETNVRSYSRNANIKERSFLRSALSDMESKITEDIQAALISAAKEGIKK